MSEGRRLGRWCLDPSLRREFVRLATRADWEGWKERVGRSSPPR